MDKGIHLKNWHDIYEDRENLAFANIQGYLILRIAMKGKALRFRQTSYRKKKKLSVKWRLLRLGSDYLREKKEEVD